jgi:hypothetical protein
MVLEVSRSIEKKNKCLVLIAVACTDIVVDDDDGMFVLFMCSLSVVHEKGRRCYSFVRQLRNPGKSTRRPTRKKGLLVHNGPNSS